MIYLKFWNDNKLHIFVSQSNLYTVVFSTLSNALTRSIYALYWTNLFINTQAIRRWYIFSTQYTVLFQIYLISLQKFYNMSFAFLALKAKNNLLGIHLGALDFARILCLRKHYLWKWDVQYFDSSSPFCTKLSRHVKRKLR